MLLDDRDQNQTRFFIQEMNSKPKEEAPTSTKRSVPISAVGNFPHSITRVCIANMIFASGALLIVLIGISGARWAGSPPTNPHAPTARMVFAGLIAFYWFAGALGLFFRKRLAWIGSMTGVGASLCLLLISLVTIVKLYIFPDAEMHRIRYFGADGYIAALVVSLGEFSILMALLIALLIGLFKMRKDLKWI